jgi:hypothetical protein
MKDGAIAFGERRCFRSAVFRLLLALFSSAVASQAIGETVSEICRPVATR